MSTASREDDAIHQLVGPELLRHLRGKWEPLPNKTLFALMLAGLKVRLARSTVTMVSIVLAIAFLAYMGLSGKLAFSLATSVRALEESSGPGQSEVRAAAAVLEQEHPAQEAPIALLQETAKLWDWTEVKEQRRGLAANESQIQRELRPRVEREEIAFTSSQADEEEKARLASSLEIAQQKLNEAEARSQELKEQIALSQMITKKRDLSTEEEQILRNKVDAAWRTHMEAVRRQGRVNETAIAGLEVLMGGLQKESLVSSAQVIRDFLQVEADRREANKITAALYRTGVNVEKTLSGSQMDTWLIVMSLLLCTVGIANAMLMSVTERFREIGTMKCLGAGDSLVVKIFLMESSMLGVVGAIIGMILGIIISLGAALLQYGWMGLQYFPFGGSLGTLFSSLGVGVLLAILGTVYPALLASRMKPVDALRIDE